MDHTNHLRSFSPRSPSRSSPSPSRSQHSYNWQDEKSKILRQWAEEKKKILVHANEDREQLMKENQKLRKELNKLLPLTRKQNSGTPFKDLYKQDHEYEIKKLENKIHKLESELRKRNSEVESLRKSQSFHGQNSSLTNNSIHEEKIPQNMSPIQYDANSFHSSHNQSSDLSNPNGYMSSLHHLFQQSSPIISSDQNNNQNNNQNNSVEYSQNVSFDPQNYIEKDKYDKEISELKRKNEKLKTEMEEQHKSWQKHVNKLNEQIESKESEKISKLRQEWEKERDSILQNWREETEILKMIWKEDKETWNKEKNELKEHHISEIRTLSEQHKHAMKDNEKALEDKEVEFEKLKKENEEIKKQLEEAQAQSEKDQLYVDSANRALEELRTKVERITSDSECSRALVEMTHQKNMEQKKAEHLKQTLEPLRAKLQKEIQVRKSLHSTIEDLKGNIRVIVRLRPLLSSEKSEKKSFSAFPEAQIEVPDDTAVTVTTGSMGTKKHDFFRALGPNAAQQDVFEELKPLIQSACDGFNICVMAYGQTGTGKTYTIHGDPETAKGVVPRAVDDLFETLKSDADISYSVKCSMVELYMDKLNDLLAEDNNNRKNLEIRQTPRGGTSIQGISTHKVNSSKELLAMLLMGTSARQTHSTAMNERSSRSHTLFMIDLELKNKRNKTTIRSKMTFVDLAGSERVSRSHSTGERFKEAQHINSSLSSLGDVISSLSRGKRSYVPYRNSKLTMLLQDSIGGNSKTVLFANISPDPRSISETLSTLQFASRVKCVRNPFVRNAFRSSRG
eukprot:gb/GECH01014740.1/.p1 GENE.gb/GECH01014740.1/~~gb/GECH01014740.1/.p1  ORF type:complete len:792 (+),score=229.73 gb/GECH01014740.1/:1-2376(+)